ncbi:hypothetical protein B0H16DRAFT_1835839 [Mycena metata]|uniref:Uncharacterized protein n=1 Tax=Mycena metata TaxID=1033252 RepID=A0AAD7GL31_9AGAR|nr:hypothetical protein B0H16DRAFT_1835839 [Mycena metata]
MFIRNLARRHQLQKRNARLEVLARGLERETRRELEKNGALMEGPGGAGVQDGGERDARKAARKGQGVRLHVRYVDAYATPANTTFDATCATPLHGGIAQWEEEGQCGDVEKDGARELGVCKSPAWGREDGVSGGGAAWTRPSHVCAHTLPARLRTHLLRVRKLAASRGAGRWARGTAVRARTPCNEVQEGGGDEGEGERGGNEGSGVTAQRGTCFYARTTGRRGRSGERKGAWGLHGVLVGIRLSTDFLNALECP